MDDDKKLMDSLADTIITMLTGDDTKDAGSLFGLFMLASLMRSKESPVAAVTKVLTEIKRRHLVQATGAKVASGIALDGTLST